MSIHIQSRGFPLTKPLKNAVEKYMADILVSHESIRAVDVRLEDINGKQRGGVDKRCQVILKQDNAPELVMRSTQDDMYLAIRKCAARLKRTLNRNSDKQNRHGKQRHYSLQA